MASLLDFLREKHQQSLITLSKTYRKKTEELECLCKGLCTKQNHYRVVLQEMHHQSYHGPQCLVLQNEINLVLNGTLKCQIDKKEFEKRRSNSMYPGFQWLDMAFLVETK